MKIINISNNNKKNRYAREREKKDDKIKTGKKKVEK